MNLTLLKQEFKNLYKSLLIFLSIISLYVIVIVMMYDPNLYKVLEELSNSMPTMFQAFGMTNSGTDLVSFIINYLYGFILILLPMIYFIYLSYKLINHYIDSKSLTYLLSSSLSRKTVVQTQISVMSIMILIITIFITTITIVFSNILFHGQLNISAFILLNVGLFAFDLLISSIIIFIGCYCNDGKKAISISAIFVVCSYLINTILSMSNSFQFLKYVNIFELYKVNQYATYQFDNFLFIAFMITTSIIISILSINKYCTRDFNI